MSAKKVNLHTRIEQANQRLSHICLSYYRGEISENDFRLEREEILLYIEKANKKKPQTPPNLIIRNNTDITGTFSAV